MNSDDLEHRFAFHAAPDQEKRDEHTSVRQACLRLAVLLNDAVPDGRELSLAITHLEEVMFWGNAGLARDGRAVGVMGDGVHTPYGQHNACECDWTYHRGKQCPNEVLTDQGGVVSSPALCTVCLFVCCAERDDEQDAAATKAGRS